MKNLLLYILLLGPLCTSAQLSYKAEVNVIPRFKAKGNPKSVKLEKIEFNDTTYYMIRYHKFAYNSRHEHPDMVPYCEHPTAYMERYYIYIFSDEEMNALDAAYHANEKYTLHFVTQGSFDKEYSVGETAAVFNWPNIKSNKAINEAFAKRGCSTTFTFDFDAKIEDFTPIHFEHFYGDVWLKNKKIEKFLSKN